MVEHSLDVYLHGQASSEFDDGYLDETASELWENCVLESVKSVHGLIYRGIFVNVIFGLANSLNLPEILFHWLSALNGIYLLLSTLQSFSGFAVILSIFISTYFLLKTTNYFEKRLDIQKPNIQHSLLTCSTLIQYILIIILVLFEHALLNPEVWLEIRGVMMVFLMKLISFTADVENGIIKFPTFSQYCGYMFCCGNILFGPWISFKHYMYQTQYPTKKTFWWISGIIRSLTLSVFFLSVSNCWSTWFIPENSNRWFLGYKEALSFRTSHYFISYLSEALILSAGWKNFEEHFDCEKWTFTITNPIKIEFPTALAIVVVNWNKPMHEFMKKYVYRKWLPLGKFYAVLLTFMMSSLFHGLEIKVSAVLISIGVFSYLQLLVRDHISNAFDICLKVYPCKNKCMHKIKRNSIINWIASLGFSLVTVLHLIYLGVLMDSSTDEVGIYQKWSELYFISLWIMFVNLLIVK